MSTLRIVVTHGGTLPETDIAALTIALTRTRPARKEEPIAAWSRAALLEGTGVATPASPAELDPLPGDRTRSATGQA